MANYETKLKTGLSALCFLAATTAIAGTVYMPPPPNRGDGDTADGYPESHFGSSQGIPRGFAAHEVSDMETPDEESGRAPARGIASVGGSPNAGVVNETGETSIVTSQAQDIPASVVARKGVQEVSVIASDLGYFPKTVFVSRDVPVRMFVTSSSKNTLCIMMDSFQVRKQIKTQKIEEITFVPTVPGKYRFYCPVNGMEGSLVVKEFNSAVPLADDFTPAQQIQTQAQAQTPGSAQEQMRSQAYVRAPSGAPVSANPVPSVASEWNSAIDIGSQSR
jgi:plastocyanin